MDELLRQVQALADAHILTWSTLVQFVLVGLFFFLARVAWMHQLPQTKAFIAQMLPPARRTPESVDRVCDMVLLAIFTLFLVIVEGVAYQLGYDHHFMKVVAQLAIAWVFIRCATFVVRDRFWAVFWALLIWGLTALHLVGWTGPMIRTLEQVDFSMGSTRLSVYLLIKGLFFFVLIMKAASMLSRTMDERLGNLRELSPSQQVLVSKTVKIAFFSVAILVGASSAGLNLTTLKIFGGAVGVGLGFGLQKIVANLVSGFILLMDRSIKPGDTIQVGTTYGWITSLSARYVSVATRDGKEHLIPNENLITNEVVNWSYTNPSVRIHVPVGVSYESDLKLAMELMVQSARKVGRVLDNPAPACRVMGFGGSSVDCEVRVWIEDPSKGLHGVISEVLVNIWDAFHENNISLPYPQRDLHLKDLPENPPDWLKKA